MIGKLPFEAMSMLSLWSVLTLKSGSKLFEFHINHSRAVPFFGAVAYVCCGYCSKRQASVIVVDCIKRRARTEMELLYMLLERKRSAPIETLHC